MCGLLRLDIGGEKIEIGYNWSDIVLEIGPLIQH